MAASAVVRLQGRVTGHPAGPEDILAELTSAAAVGDRRSSWIVLPGSTSTIPVPTGATGAVVVPPRDNATVIPTLVLLNGETGIALHRSLPSVVTFDGQANFFLKGNGTGALIRVDVAFF